MKNILELTSEQLRRAAQIKEQISSLEKQLENLLGQAPAAKRNGGMSASARAKISAAAKARWARVRAEKGGSSAKTGKKPAARKPMTAAQKARIAAAMKARWAKIKAAKKGA